MKLRIDLRVTARLIVLSVLLTACTARISLSDSGVETYDGIQPGGRSLTYGFAETAPEWLDRSLTLALAQWNHALGTTRLQKVAAGSNPDIQIVFEPTKQLLKHPGVAELAGCMDGFERFAKCRIRLALPDRVDGGQLLSDMSFLFRAGAIDQAMHASHDYVLVEDFLRDKLATLVLAHEIGHTLGLGHAQVKTGCLMAAMPTADAAPCAAEIEAARVKLSLR